MLSEREKAKDALDQAVRDYVNASEEEPSLVVDWIMCAAAKSAETLETGHTVYHHSTNDGSSSHSTIGLLDTIKHFIQFDYGDD